LAEITPLWLQAPDPTPSYNAVADRHLLTAIMGARAFVTGSIGAPALDNGGGHGVAGDVDLAVAANGTPNMSVNVAPGVGVVKGTQSIAQGAYVVGADATENLTIATADGTNPRKDLVWIRVRDSEESGSDDDCLLGITTGTPAGSPSDPTPPANSLVLARVTVPAGASSITGGNITDLRTHAFALGGVCYCTSASLPNPARVGQLVYERDQDRVRVYDGAAWKAPYALGHIAADTSDANVTLSDTSVKETNASVTITNSDGVARNYAIYASAYFNLASGASGLYRVAITEAGTAVDDAATRVKTDTSGGPGQVGGMTRVVRTIAAGASKIYKAAGKREVGTTSDVISAGAVISVEDIGPT